MGIIRSAKEFCPMCIERMSWFQRGKARFREEKRGRNRSNDRRGRGRGQESVFFHLRNEEGRTPFQGASFLQTGRLSNRLSWNGIGRVDEGKTAGSVRRIIQIESKTFDLTAEGVEVLRVVERSRGFQRSIWLSVKGAIWLLNTLEKISEGKGIGKEDCREVEFQQVSFLSIQRNERSCFIRAEEWLKGVRRGEVIIPAAKEGEGWGCFLEGLRRVMVDKGWIADRMTASSRSSTKRVQWDPWPAESNNLEEDGEPAGRKEQWNRVAAEPSKLKWDFIRSKVGKFGEEIEKN